MDTIGKRLKAWRLENKLTTSEVAKTAEISQSVLSSYENDKSIIGGKAIISLYRNYDIDIKWLLTGEKQENTNLSENDKELLEHFNVLPEREQIKLIGIVEEKAKIYKESSEKLSDSRTG